MASVGLEIKKVFSRICVVSSGVLMCWVVIGCSDGNFMGSGKNESPNESPKDKAESPSADTPKGKNDQPPDSANPSKSNEPSSGNARVGAQVPGNPNGSILHLIHGGYSSCGDGNDPNDQAMTQLKTYIDENIDGKRLYFISCYSSDANFVYWSSSNDKTKVGSGSLDQMIAAIKSGFPASGVKLSHIIGHSYGGWTAMKVTQGLAETYSLGALVTLDPISKKDCTPQGFIDTILSGSPPQIGCTRAPGDFSVSAIANMKSVVKQWENYYQTNYDLLHSGPIEGANNHKKSYSGSSFEPHNGFIYDEQIFADIVKILK